MNDNKPNIVPVTPGRVAELRRISITTFKDTYGAANTPEDMAKYLEGKFSMAQLTYELGRPDTQYYFAELDKAVAGYLKVNLAEEMEVERIYVLPSHKGRGIGRALIHHAIDIARKAGIAEVWLGVWQKNQQAIQFYEKLGFKVFDTHIFRLGDDEQTDFKMRLVV